MHPFCFFFVPFANGTFYIFYCSCPLSSLFFKFSPFSHFPLKQHELIFPHYLHFLILNKETKKGRCEEKGRIFQTEKLTRLKIQPEALFFTASSPQLVVWVPVRVEFDELRHQGGGQRGQQNPRLLPPDLHTLHKNGHV
jgi:hypothetical protein